MSWNFSHRIFKASVELFSMGWCGWYSYSLICYTFLNFPGNDVTISGKLDTFAGIPTETVDIVLRNTCANFGTSSTICTFFFYLSPTLLLLQHQSYVRWTRWWCTAVEERQRSVVCPVMYLVWCFFSQW